MIRITDINGQTHYLAPQTIARITEAGTSSQWHGIRSFVHTSDGQTIEASDRPDEIANRIAALTSLQAANGHLCAQLQRALASLA